MKQRRTVKRMSQAEEKARRDRVIEFVTRPGVDPGAPWDIHAIAAACDCAPAYVNGLQWRLSHPNNVREAMQRSNETRLKRRRREASRLVRLVKKELATVQKQTEEPIDDSKNISNEVQETVKVIEAPKRDMVNAPSHYTHGGIETIHYIRAKLSRDEYIGYLKGNIIKYSSRLGLKDDVVQDAGKLNWYTRELANFLEGK